MVLFKLIDRLIGVVSVVLLARLLTPADFGLIAMATSVVALIELMSAFGFDTALIQRPDAQRRHFDTAWTFQVIFGVVAALLLVVVAIPAATFYRDPRIAHILPVLAAASLFTGFANIGPVLFRKELDFAREFRFLLAKRLAAFMVTLMAAWWLRTYWALVAGIVTGSFVAMLISYLMHPYRPRLSLGAARELMHFSKWLFASNIVSFLQAHADKFILGRTVGSRDLGLYNLAQEVAALPSTAVIAPINRAVFPAYAALNGDLIALERRFLVVIGQIAAVAMPLSFGLAVLAEPVVSLLLGTQWLESVPLLQTMVIVGLVGALQSNLFSMILALGQPKWTTVIGASLALLSLPLMAVMSSTYGAQGAAAAHVIIAFAGLVPLHIVFFRLTRFRVVPYLTCLIRPVMAAALAACLVYLGLDSVSWPPVAELLVGAVVGTGFYVATGLGLWWLWGRPADSAEAELIRRAGALRIKLLRRRLSP